LIVGTLFYGAASTAISNTRPGGCVTRPACGSRDWTRRHIPAAARSHSPPKLLQSGLKVEIEVVQRSHRLKDVVGVVAAESLVEEVGEVDRAAISCSELRRPDGGDDIVDNNSPGGRVDVDHGAVFFHGPRDRPESCDFQYLEFAAVAFPQHQVACLALSGWLFRRFATHQDQHQVIGCGPDDVAFGAVLKENFDDALVKRGIVSVVVNQDHRLVPGFLKGEIEDLN